MWLFGTLAYLVNEPDNPPKRTKKKVRLGIYNVKIRQHQVSELISQEIRAVENVSEWLIANLSTLK